MIVTGDYYSIIHTVKLSLVTISGIVDEGDLLPMHGSCYKRGYRPNLSAFAIGKCIGTVHVCMCIFRYYVD